MTPDDPTGPGARSKRASGDPLVMTEAEKRAAEWEARHDVAARGRRVAPDAVRRYLAHQRLSGQGRDRR